MLRKGMVALCVAGGLFASAAANAGLNDGLVGFWNFDDCDAADVSGNSNTGTTLAGCNAGQVGSALFFDGNTSIALPQSASINSNVFSISAWIKPTHYGTWAPYGSIIFSNYDGLYNGSFFYLSTDGKIGITTASASSQSSEYIVGTTTIDLNRWAHVAATFDGTTLKVFVNGNQDGSKIVTIHPTASRIAPTMAKPSWSDLPRNSYFVGGIDEARFYNRILSNTEIQQLGSTACDVQTSYNQGYSAAQAACRANPSSCGITVGTSPTASGHATYSPSTNAVHVPFLDVPNIFGGASVVYETDWTLVPNSNPLQLQLQNARQVQ